MDKATAQPVLLPPAAPARRGASPPLAQTQRTAPTGRLWRVPLLVAGLFFAAMFPTLHWAGFHDPIENLNVATAMEMRRGGPWLVPTLQGRPRLAKPPLTAWATAASLRPSTLAAVDAAADDAAFDRLARDARWPSLLAACLMLGVVFEIGRTIGDGGGEGARVGLIAACACGTTLIFVRQGRMATTDLHLALWVAVTNLFLVKLVFERRVWLGCLGAGAGLGLVLMSKGPVGFVQTVLPVGMFVLLRAWRRRRDDASAGLPASAGSGPAEAAQGLGMPRLALPLLVGLVLATVVGGWWFAVVAARHEGTSDLWLAEVTRVDADAVPAGRWHKHFTSLPYLFLPWVVWLFAGAWVGAAALFARRRGATRASDPSWAGPALALLLLLVPLVVMSCVKDRFQRYLVPLAPAGSLLVAFAIVVAGRSPRAAPGEDRADARRSLALSVGHWCALAAIAVGFPVAAASGRMDSLMTADGRPWFSPAAAALASCAALAAIAAGFVLHRRWPDALWVTTVGVMLVVQAAYAHRYGQSPTGRSDLRPLAALIRRDHPNAEVYVRGAPGRRNVISIHGNDLSIHLNRAVRWAPSAADIPASPKPQVWLVAQPRRQPPPPALPGWTPLLKVEGTEPKYAFVRAGVSG